MSIIEHHEKTQASTSVEDNNPTPSAREAGSHEPDEKQVPPLGVNSSVGMTAILDTNDSGEEPTASGKEPGAAGDSGEEPTANSEERNANTDPQPATAVKLCHHVLADGAYCQIPALGGRSYCYRHLQLRGQQMRMARAIAQRQPYHLVLPPLDDMHAVQAALVHVTAAMVAGLLERGRAGLLLYALQQAASNLRFLAQIQTEARAQSQTQPDVAPAVGAPPLPPSVGDRVGPGAPPRVVEDYPDFEAEFGLPPGLDLTVLPQVVFPPPEHAAVAAAAGNTAWIHPLDRWTKEAIELEELERQHPDMSNKTVNERSCKLHDALHRRAANYLRKEREAEWEAEAARRNAKEDEQAQRWNSMDAAQQRAFLDGVTLGRQEAAAEAQAKNPAARANGDGASVGTVESPETGKAK